LKKISGRWLKCLFIPGKIFPPNLYYYPHLPGFPWIANYSKKLDSNFRYAILRINNNQIVKTDHAKLDRLKAVNWIANNQPGRLGEAITRCMNLITEYYPTKNGPKQN